MCVFSGGTPGFSADSQPVNQTVVAAIKVARGELAQLVMFDAELLPFQEIDLHSKASGYLRSLSVDAGDRVKEGQSIGDLEVPELQAELDQAKATAAQRTAVVERTRAVASEAELAHSRLVETSKAQNGLIAAHELDSARLRAQSAAAEVAAAKASVHMAQAEVKKFETLLSYTRITAPFPGVVTKRYVHAGALIQAGTGSGSTPLVRLSQNDKLRVVFPVSLTFVSRIRVGDRVEIHVPSVTKNFTGKVARFSRKVETHTRTMMAEVDLPNPDLALIPGVYATVVLTLDQKNAALVVPIEAVSHDKDGATVILVTPERKLEERKVTLGIETPTQLEIAAGLSEGDLVMMGNRAQFQPGQTVEVKILEPRPAH